MTEPENVPVEEPVAAPQIDFQDGCERELWSQVLNQVDDMVMRYVKCVSDVAISGPNRLDLTFPKSYHWNKQYCEKPEVLGRIEEVASKMTGRSIRVTLLVAESEQETASESEPAIEPKPRMTVNPENDEFVQQAISVFGATVAKVDSITGQSARKE